MIKTGIEIYGKVTGGPVLDKLANDAKKAKTEVSSLGSVLKGLGGIATGVNQGLEVGKKVIEGLGAAHDATAGKALALRAANDPARQSIDALAASTDKVGVSIGNTVIPVVSALATAVTPVLTSLGEWVDKNRDVIASTTIDGITKIGTVLTTVVEPAVKGVVLAWDGWKMLATEAPKWASDISDSFKDLKGPALIAWEATKKIADGLTGGVASSIGPAIDGAKQLGKLFGVISESDFVKTGLEATNVGKVGEVFDKIRTSLAGLGPAVEKNLTTPIRLAGKGLIDLGFGFGRVSDAAVTEAQRFGQVWAGALEGMKTKIAGLGESMNRDAAASSAAAFDADIARKRRETTTIIAFNDMVAKNAKDRRAEEVADWTSKYGTAFSFVAGGITTMVGQALDGTASAVEVAGGFFKSLAGFAAQSALDAAASWAAGKLAELTVTEVTAAAEIKANTAVAASSAIAAHAGIPFAGIGIGIAAAAAIGAAIAGIARFAEGGFVKGGIPGKDSVLALMQQDEYVTKTSDVRRNLAAGREPGDNGRPRPGERRGGGSGTPSVTVVVPVQSLLPPSAIEVRRAVQDQVGPALEHLFRTGRIKLPGQGG